MPQRILIIGDLSSVSDRCERAVSFEEIDELCKQYGLTYLEVDSRTGFNYLALSEMIASRYG